MKKTAQKSASKVAYVSPQQLVIPGFETPFSQHLDANNRWVKLASLIPWDALCGQYLKKIGISSTGRPPINPRIVIGSLIIKHLGDLDDRETVAQISENPYMQYFLGYSSFCSQKPFDASLFVEFRKNIDIELINSINDVIIAHQTSLEAPTSSEKNDDTSNKSSNNQNQTEHEADNISVKEIITHKGTAIMDATACPQNIAYPTDLGLLNSAREKSEDLIDLLYNKELHKKKPRTDRDTARKLFLQTAQKRKKTRNEIRKAIRRQLGFLRRNIRSIDTLLDSYDAIPLKPKDYKYMLVIRHVLEQQETMFNNKSHSIEHRIVSIHQPHVRPIVRGKAQAAVEFGSKIHLSLIDGFSFLDELSWEAFNEGSHLERYIEQYKQRFGFYPHTLLVDKIYCTRENRRYLKEKGIELHAKPLGRPKAVGYHVSPGERNPIEGKFGQAKTAYGLNCIRARLQVTSQSWIASIILVLNLVKLAGVIPYCLCRNFITLLNWCWRIACLKKNSDLRFFLSFSGG